MFSAATKALFARNVVCRGSLVIYFSVFEIYYVLLSFLMLHYDTINTTKCVEYSVGNRMRHQTTVIKSTLNAVERRRSVACRINSLVSVALRTASKFCYCHGVLCSARFITTHYFSHFRHDCSGGFFNCEKNLLWCPWLSQPDMFAYPVPLRFLTFIPF